MKILEHQAPVVTAEKAAQQRQSPKAQLDPLQLRWWAHLKRYLGLLRH